MADRPRAREKHVTGGGSGVNLRGSASGGPVGSGPRPGGGGGNGGPGKAIGGGGIILFIIIIILSKLGIFGDGDSSSYDDGGNTGTQTVATSSTGSSGSDYFSALSGTSTGWGSSSNTGKLNREVSPEARIKYTDILGGGKDVVTLMVYMCGTDLESKYGMGSNDLKEMMNADLSDKVNIIVYTGGSKKWSINGISNKVHQIYQIKNGKMNLLEADMGNSSMTDPSCLSGFIKYCAKNYPANRNMLIFWDHGGGSLSGFGYDELKPSSGSMDLGGINDALSSAGVKFDFIGFDACLMATVETDLMCAEYADYLIASEETEPGLGWYYTNWLNALSDNTSMETIEIGKMIADDFVEVCAKQVAGQKTTLSIVDLAELSQTVGDEFKNFSNSTKDLIKLEQYAKVSQARSNTREFSPSSKLDQVDLVHFAKNVGTDEGNALAETVLSAVKYNRTSSNMTNAYGVSIYFPYRTGQSKVKQANNLYSEIGLDSDYSACIREFAGVQGAGQAAGGGDAFSLLGGGEQQSSFDLDSILSFVSDMGLGSRSLSDEETAKYVYEHQLDQTLLTWKKGSQGYYIELPEEQWELVQSVDLSLYVDNGQGYLDMGLDNVYTFDDKGNLVADADGTWLSINSQPVAYYHIDTVDYGDDYTITGRVPAELNGERVNLILLFTDEEPYGYIAGADPDYDDSVTETVSRGLVEIKDGDKVDFICDCYDYNGNYRGSYYLGDTWVVNGKPQISNTEVGAGYTAMYKFTDIYDNSCWTDQLP